MHGEMLQKRLSAHKAKLYWFTEELHVERNKLHAIYRRHVRNLNNQGYTDAFAASRNLCKKDVKQGKKKSWFIFCEKTSNTCGMLYKYIRGKNINFSV